MRLNLAIALTFLLASPASTQEDTNFNIFLSKFRVLYYGYHFGPKWSKEKVDKEAARIWSGSGAKYEYAAITACQGIFETHFNPDPICYGHRGNCGMRSYTIIAEAVRIGIMAKIPEDKIWILKQTRKDQTYADFLAASRLVYLIKVCGGEREALRTWLTGQGWRKNEKDRIRSLSYSKGVLSLRKLIFGGKK